jgi:hypothetical protein
MLLSVTLLPYGGSGECTGAGLGGMTVNERLVIAGLLGEFDAAMDAVDRQRAINVLEQVAMTEQSAAATVDAVLADPSKYGYPRPS